MAKGLNVKANLSLDTTQAKMQLKSLQKEISKLASNTGLSSLGGQTGLTSELTNAVKLTSQLQSALKGATNDLTGNLDLTKFNDSLRRSGTTLSDYQSTLRSLGTDGAKAFNDLNKAILSAETPMLRTTEMAKETLTTLGNTVRWQATSSLIHGVMGAASQAMSYVQRLDKSLNSIQIVTGKSADTMSNFAKQANAAAKNLSTTTNEYAKAALIYYQQGLSDQQVAGRVETTLKLANVSGQTAAKVSDQMTSIWNNFYDGSKSLEYYADVMTALGASTATSSKEIAQGLSKFSSIAKTTGLSYEYATSALATITAATRQSADSVGTSLKTMFSRLQGLSLGDTLEDGTTLNKYSKALLAIGVNIKEANGQLKGMDSILNEIGNKWQTLNKDTQIALAQTVGGVRNYTSLMTLMNNWDQFRTNVGTARMANGTLQKQADIYADSWEAAQTRVRAASESIYKNLIDDQVFKGMTNNLATTLETVGKVTDAMGGFKGVLLSTAGVATQLFGGEISQALGNVGYNINSVLGGQKEVQQLRQEALKNLLTPSNRLDTIVDDIETSLNKNLVDRITTYQTKVSEGKIAEWQTAAYQQLLQKAAEQDERTLAALQTAEQAERVSSRYGYTFQQNLRTAANAITDATMKNAAEDFLQGSGRYKNAGGRQAYEGLEDIAKTSMVLEELNIKYEKAIPSEKGVASSTTAMKSLAGTILQLGAGAKELNMSFKDLVGDKDTAVQLEHLYNSLNDFIAKTGPITESNLKKYQDFFEDRFGDFGATLQNAIDNSAYGGQGFSNQLGELQSQLVNSFGMTAEQAAQTVSQIKAQSQAVGETQLSRVMNVGASVESNKAIMDQLNSNTRKHMDISQAITDQIALFTSSAAAYGTVVQTLNTLTSGSANAMDRIVALGTSFGTLKSALSAAGNVFENFNSQIDIFGKSSPLTVGGLTAISGATLGMVELGKSAIQAYQDSTVEAQIARLQEAAVFAKEQSSVATESYETLLSSSANYNTLLNELYTLKSGTSDFAQTLLATNEAALNLADRYGLTATRGSYGEILFDSAELREKTQAYETAAMEAQTRALLGTQLSSFYESYAEYNRLNDTVLWDKDKNLGNYLSNLGTQVGSLAGQVFDTITSPFSYIFPGDPKGISNFKESVGTFFGNLGNSIITNAEKLITDSNFLSQQTEDALMASVKHLELGTGIGQLVNQEGQLTLEKLANTYNAYIQAYEQVGNLPIKDYTTFKNFYGISDMTLAFRTPTDWTDVVQNGKIDWGLAQEKLGQELSNLIPQSFESALKYSLGLSDEATDEDIGNALRDYNKNQELNQLRLEATTANMVNGVIAGEADLSSKQQLAAQLLGISGATGLYSFIPETVESLQRLNLEDLQTKYKKEVNPLNDEYLKLTKDQLIAAIQTEELRENILNQVNEITKDITASDLQIARNYQQMAISELNKDNIDDKWGNFYRYQGAMAIENLGEVILNSFSPENLQSTFSEVSFGENFAQNFGKALGNWVVEQGYSIEDVRNLANITGSVNNAFGQKSAQYVFNALTQNGTLKGGLDSNTQKALRAINFDSSLQAMASLRAQRDYITDSSLREILGTLYDKAVDDIGGESGLFAKLLNSSDFAKVASSLEQVYQETGEISASLVQALSKKSPSLNAYLDATMTGNAGSVAAIMTSMFKGNLDTSDLTNQVMDAFGYAFGGTGSQAARQEEISNFDFEDSSASIINKWFKNAGTGVKNGWNAGFLTDPSVMQIMNMMASSTKSSFYSSIAGGLSNQLGAKTILQNFKSSDPAAATFFNKLTSKYGATMTDLMNYIQAETGLYQNIADDLFTLTSAGYSLNGNMKESFANDERFAAYREYLQNNYKEFTKVNGELDVDYLFNSAEGFRRFTEDYLSGNIKDKNGNPLFGHAWFDEEDARTWAGMITEQTASEGMAQKWDVKGIEKALNNFADYGFVRDDILEAFYNEAIANNENPIISGKYKDYTDFKTNAFNNVDIIGEDYWNKGGSFWQIFGNSQHLRDVLTKEGAAGDFGVDFKKTIDYFQSALGMSVQQALDAVKTAWQTAGGALDDLGAYIYDETGKFEFVNYADWRDAMKAAGLDGSIEAFWELAKKDALENMAQGFTTDLFNGIKDALGLQGYDTTKLQGEFSKYFKSLSSDGGVKTIAGFLKDVFNETWIGQAIQGVGNFFKGIAEGFTNFFTDNNLDYYFGQNGKGIGDFIKDTISGAVEDLKAGAPKLANTFANILGISKWKESGQFWDNGEPILIEKTASELWKDIGSTVADSVKGAIGGTLDFIDNLIDWNFVVEDESGDGYNLGESFKNLGNQIISRITTGIGSLIPGVADYVVGKDGTLWKNIYDDLGNIIGSEQISDLSEVWSDIGTNIFNNISSLINDKFVPFINDTVIPKLTEWGMTGLSALDGIFGDTNFFNPDASFVENLANLGNDLLGRVLAGISGLVTGEKVDISQILTDGQIDLGKASLGLRKTITPFLEKVFGDNIVVDEDKIVDLGATIGNIKDKIVNGFNDFLYNIYDFFAGDSAANISSFQDKNGKLNYSDLIKATGNVIKNKINNFYEGAVKALFPDNFDDIISGQMSIWDAIGNKIHDLPYDIANALVPDLSPEDIKKFAGGENATAWDVMSFAVSDNIASFLDKLTGNQFAWSSTIRTSREYGDGSFGLGNVFSQLFSPEGMKAIGSTLSTAVSSALGTFGQKALDFFSGGDSGYTFVDGKFYRNSQLENGIVKEGETGTSFGSVLRDIAEAGLANFATGGQYDYHGFNGRLYTGSEWDSTTGTPTGYGTGGDTPTGVSAMDATIAGIISSLGLGDYRATENGIFKFENGEITDQQFSLGGLVQSLGSDAAIGMAKGLGLDWLIDVSKTAGQTAETIQQQGFWPFLGNALLKGATYDFWPSIASALGLGGTSESAQEIRVGENGVIVRQNQFGTDNQDLMGARDTVNTLMKYGLSAEAAQKLADNGFDLTQVYGPLGLQRRSQMAESAISNILGEDIYSQIASNSSYDERLQAVSQYLQLQEAGWTPEQIAEGIKNNGSLNKLYETFKHDQEGIIPGGTVSPSQTPAGSGIVNPDQTPAEETPPQNLSDLTGAELEALYNSGQITPEQFNAEASRRAQATVTRVYDFQKPNAQHVIPTTSGVEDAYYDLVDQQGNHARLTEAEYNDMISKAENIWNSWENGGPISAEDLKFMEGYANVVAQTTGNTDLLNAINGLKGLVENIDDNVTTSTELAEEAAETESESSTMTHKGNGIYEDENGNQYEVDDKGDYVPVENPEPTYSGGGGNGSGSEGGGGNGSGSNGSGGNGGSGGTGGGKAPSFSGETVAKSIQNFFEQNTTLAQDQYKIGDNTYTYLKDEDGGVVGFTDDQTGISYDMEGTPIGGQAIGQNNTHILQFASGKEGHMAVTGELGPELTIREDGSIDMLGRRGREYAWVNPGDIIYTAAQTASILGNNNIAWLDGFSKGFNNKIRGYSAGGSVNWDIAGETGMTGDGSWTPANNYSGNSGSVGKAAYSGGKAGALAGMEEAEEKDPRYDMYTLKERDIITRYFTILQQLDDITREITYFANQAERSWGQDRVNAIHRQTEAYEKQLDSYLEYQRQVEKYLQTDKSALTQMIEEVADALRNKTSIEFYGGEASKQQGGVAGAKYADRTNSIYQAAATGQNNNIRPHAHGWLSDGKGMVNTVAGGSFGSTGTESGDPAMRTPINWTMPIYDKNGVLTNYEEVVKAMMEIYNENAELFAQDKEAQYKFQEMLKDIQYYTDTLNLYEQNQQTLIQLRQQILDNQIREVVYKLELDNELDMNELREINYEFTKIKDSAYDAADRIDYYATKLDYLDKQNKRIVESMKDVLATYSGNITNGIQHKFNFTFYRKAPMEGYLGVDEDSLSAMMSNGMYMDIGSNEYSAKEVLRIGGSGANSISNVAGNIPGLTAEEKKKLKIDYIDDSTGFIHLNDGSWIDPKKKKRYRKKKTTGSGEALSSGGAILSDSSGFATKVVSGNIYNSGEFSLKDLNDENSYVDEYGIKHKTKGTENTGNTSNSNIGGSALEMGFGINTLYSEQDLLNSAYSHYSSNIGGSKMDLANLPEGDGLGLVTVFENGHVTNKRVDSAALKKAMGGALNVPSDAKVISGSGNSVGYINEGSPINGFAIQAGSSGNIPNEVMSVGDWKLHSVDIGGTSGGAFYDGISDYASAFGLGSGNSEDEIEELPYFPSEYEINEYMKNFKKVKIGEETYYIPISDDVEIRDDITPGVKLDEIILNNKGELTKDMKEIVTAQVQGWYDELVKLHPELAVDIIPEYDKQGFMTNYREVMEKINEVNAKMSEEMYQLLLTDPQKFYDEFSKITDLNINFENLTASTVAMFENYVQQLYDNINQGKQFAEAAVNELSSYIKQTYKDLQRELSEFDFFEEVLQNYKDIISLTNRQQSNIDRGIIEQLSQVSYGNAVNKIKGAKTIYEQQEKEFQETKKLYDKSKADFERIKQELTDQGLSLEDMKKSYTYSDAVALMRNFEKDLQDANAKMESAEKDMLKSWEDALDKALDKYNTHMDEAARAFQESFNPMFTSIQAFQDQLEREQAIEDLYVSDYQRIHDLSALNRSIEQSILDTDNLKSKTRLRDLQKEINELQESNIKLSAYDLDILNKKYQVELARQALEDAKNAKSVVRLSRDNNGNWSYVYTSDDVEIEEAEQRYENAIRDMEQSTQEYGKAFQSQVGQITDEVAAQLAAITPDSFNGDREAQQRARENIMKSAEASLNFIYEQFNKVFGDNSWLGSYIKDIYGENNHNLYNTFGDTMLGKMPEVGSLDSLIQHSLDMLRDYNVQTDDYIEELYNDQKEAYEAAGVDIENAGEWFAKAAELLADSSVEQVKVVDDLAEQIDFEFDRLIEKLDEFFEKYLDAVRTYDIIEQEILAHNMKEFIAIRAADEGIFRLDYASAVDTYEELEAVKQALARYGEILVTDFDENGIQHFYELAEGTTQTAEQLSKWFDAAAKNDAIDVGKDLDTREEYNKINKYLEAHGQVYLEIDGELKQLSKDNKDDMAWLKEKLTAIEKAEEEAKKSSISYISSYDDAGGGHAESNAGIYVHYYNVGESGHNESYVWSTSPFDENYTVPEGTTSGSQVDTGGYTGRWQGGIYADSGMYTGEWPNGSVRRNGRLAWLHQKELVLNAHDTENFLDAMNIVRQLDNLTSWMANGLGDLFSPRVEAEEGTLQQEVHIDASFPNVVDHNEIEEAFGNLVNLASQYANRKAFV